MSHLIEEYAKSCGVKIGKPQVCEAFFPISFPKYITLQTTKKFQSRDYSYWSDVVSILKKVEPQLKIVQVGSPEDPLVEGIDQQLLGVTSLQQLLYIIKNSSGHVGIDSLGIHIASMYDRPIVGLYSNMRPENSGPYWNDSSPAICITPEFDKRKPSYSTEENPKVINTIPPEEIAAAVLKMIKSQKTLDQYQSLFLGSEYPIGVLEVCPDFANNQIIPPDHPVNIRLDWHFDLNLAASWATTRKCNFFVDRELDLQIFKQLKQNINQINFFIDSSTSVEFIEQLHNTGVKVMLYTKDTSNLADLRLKFIDWIVHEYETSSKNDIDKSSKICNNTKYKSSKSILSKNKIYHSKAAMTLNIPRSGAPQKIIDNEEFWADIKNIYIYNE